MGWMVGKIDLSNEDAATPRTRVLGRADPCEPGPRWKVRPSPTTRSSRGSVAAVWELCIGVSVSFSKPRLLLPSITRSARARHRPGSRWPIVHRHGYQAGHNPLPRGTRPCPEVARNRQRVIGGRNMRGYAAIAFGLMLSVVLVAQTPPVTGDRSTPLNALGGDNVGISNSVLRNQPEVGAVPLSWTGEH